MDTSREIERLRSLTGAKWQRVDADVIPAWVADMDFPTAPAIVEALGAMVDASDFGYNAVSFDDSVAAAWAHWSSQRFGWSPEIDRIKVFANALQPIAAALATATSPGDGVVLLTPVYPPFFGMVEKAGRRIVEYRLDADDWRIDAQRLRALIDPGTRALILCNPHNPSGRAFERTELEAVMTIAEEFDLLVISDEIWQDIVYPGGAGHVPFASLGPQAESRCVTVTSASKSFSLGGLSCAVGHLGHAAVRDGISSMPPHLLGGVNALGARAAIEAWTHGGEWLEATVGVLRSNRDHLRARLGGELPEVSVTSPEATYLAWLDFRQTSIADDPAKHLLERGRLVLSPGPDFGPSGAGFARLNFATHRGVLDTIVDRILETVHEPTRSGRGAG